VVPLKCADSATPRRWSIPEWAHIEKNMAVAQYELTIQKGSFRGVIMTNKISRLLISCVVAPSLPLLPAHAGDSRGEDTGPKPSPRAGTKGLDYGGQGAASAACPPGSQAAGER
jgi:hypothetical protein